MRVSSPVGRFCQAIRSARSGAPDWTRNPSPAMIDVGLSPVGRPRLSVWLGKRVIGRSRTASSLAIDGLELMEQLVSQRPTKKPIQRFVVLPQLRYRRIN